MLQDGEHDRREDSERPDDWLNQDEGKKRDKKGQTKQVNQEGLKGMWDESGEGASAAQPQLFFMSFLFFFKRLSVSAASPLNHLIKPVTWQHFEVMKYIR